jgi:hypothetical protein
MRILRYLRNLLRIAAWCLLLGAGVHAQNFTIVTAGNLQDLTGNKLASGEVCFQAVTNQGVPIGYQAGGGGQVINVPRCAGVVNGAFSLSVANTALTTPAHICYKVTVKDLSTGQLVLGNGQPGMPSGYECVQPVGGGFNFDSFVPNLSPQVAVVQGAVISGMPLAGDCAQWISPFLIGDAGAPCGTGSGGSGSWGKITGTLANQTDLQSALNAKANSSTLAPVALSGSYNDLTNKPAIPAAQVNSDWNAVSGMAQILNKPALGTAAAQPATAFLAVPAANGIVKSTGAGATAAATGSDVISLLGYTPASTSSVAANVVTITADNTGATDVSAAVATALTTIYNEGGGTVFFPAGTFLINSQVAIPNNGANPPKHPAIKIQCAGGNFSLDGTPPTGGTILNLAYSGSVAKLTDFAFGTLEIAGCTFQETSATTTTPFLMTTNATLQLHDNFVSGYAGNSGTANDQDFLILGGTGTTTTGDSTGWFQGYGGYIQHNFAQHIRRFVYLQSAANSIPITENTIFFTAGSNLAGGAAIEIGTVAQGARGNIIRDNLIESPYYPYPVKVVNGSGNVLQNQFWDCNATGTVTAALYDFESGATANYIYSAFNDSGCPALFRDVSAAPGQNIWGGGTVGTTLQSSGVGGPTANFGSMSTFDIFSSGISTRTSSAGMGTMLRWNNTSGNSSNWHGEAFAYDYGNSIYKTFDVDGAPVNIATQVTGTQVNIGQSTYHTQAVYSNGSGSLPSTGIYATFRYNNSEGELFTYNYGTSSFVPTAISQLLLGQASTPGTLGFNGYSNYGLAFNASTGVVVQHAGASIFGTRTAALEITSGASVAWSSSGYGSTMDTGLSRSVAGVVNVGNGTAGDYSGTAKMTGLTTQHANQLATNSFAGTCAMTSATSCTWSLTVAYTSTPICIANVQGTTAIAGACSVSGTMVTITAASSNSQTWGAVLIGNPN